MRIEKDAIGKINVPEDKYWGAQTQRSLHHFPAGHPWPEVVISSFGLLKSCCAKANTSLELLDKNTSAAIQKAADEVRQGKLNQHFPVRVFQTGSGTHSNMNANEVIANRANEILGQPLGENHPVHPNDHVNMGQSSNDVFPTVMHIALCREIHGRLIPTLEQIHLAFEQKMSEWDGIVKTGRTHLQDAAPLTLAQEVSGWAAQIHFAIQQLKNAAETLLPLALGGTAVGTGLNAHPSFAELVCDQLASITELQFQPAPNRFAALASHEPLLQVSSALKITASALMKIANDVRWLGSGPYCGLGELTLPANEPGSSIMPGKVNPTQCEAITQICVQIYGHDAAVGFAASQGNFELNVYKPVMLHNILEPIELLCTALPAFKNYCIDGLKANKKKINDDLNRNPMLATALNQHIGYEKASEIVKYALKNNLPLKESAQALEYVTEEEYDEWVQPLAMTHH